MTNDETADALLSPLRKRECDFAIHTSPFALCVNMWQNIASRSFGSNHVLLGGMIPPPSATVISSSMLVGNIAKAQANSPLFTNRSRYAVPRMPPPTWMVWLVRG